MKTKRIIPLLLAAVMALTACGSQTSGSESSTQQTAPVGVAVQVQPVEVKEISTDNRVSGKVVSDNEHSIMVATTAKCTAVYVQAGDTVEAGDKICTLDMASTLAQYNAAKITYQSTVNQYNDQKAILNKQIQLAEDNVNITRALFEIGAASQMEVDNAELQLAQAKAGRDSGLAQLEAGMQSYKSNVEQLNLVMENVDSNGNVVAPVSGVVASLTAVENGFVSSSMPVAVIDGADQMKVSVMVSESLVPKLVIGAEADVVISAANAAFLATIRSVEKTANMQTKLYTVTLTVPADVAGLMSGMFADVNFRTETAADAVVVPTEAILTSAGVQYVFVVENGAAKQVAVTTGLTSAGVTQITTGLVGGEELVVMGQAYLSDGDAVRVVSGEG